MRRAQQSQHTPSSRYALSSCPGQGRIVIGFLNHAKSLIKMIAALILLRRNRDGWAALVLAGAVWIKLFPIVLLPIALLDRILKRRWRDTAILGGVFALASAAINAPFAL